MQTGRLVGIAYRERKRGPMLESASAEITTASGVVGDTRGRPGGRQVTVVDRGAWRAVGDELGEDVPWTVRRANLLIDGIDLEDSAGRRLKIGSVLLEITCETTPCYRMEEQRRGLVAALGPSWRGGVCCRVLGGGIVRPGATVTLLGV